MRLPTAGVFVRISIASTRPRPSLRGMSCWEMMPRRDSLTMTRICSRWSMGKTSSTRSSVRAALPVWRVPSTRWPVSEAVMASEMVSRSRISPTMMTSGSSRSAPRRAAPKDLVCVWTSRWVTWQPLDVMTYSIGSSSVMMWSWRDLFTSSTSAASVVDLPEPTEPVTSTRPLWYCVSSLRDCGRPRSSIERRFVLMMRKTTSIPSRCRTTLARKRPNSVA